MDQGGIGRKKDRNLTRDPRASLCIDEGFRYVTLEGTIGMIDDQVTAQADNAAPAGRCHDATQAEEMTWDKFAREERVSLLVHVGRADGHGFDDKE